MIKGTVISVAKGGMTLMFKPASGVVSDITKVIWKQARHTDHEYPPLSACLFVSQLGARLCAFTCNLSKLLVIPANISDKLEGRCDYRGK